MRWWRHRGACRRSMRSAPSRCCATIAAPPAQHLSTSCTISVRPAALTTPVSSSDLSGRCSLRGCTDIHVLKSRFRLLALGLKHLRRYQLGTFPHRVPQMHASRLLHQVARPSAAHCRHNCCEAAKHKNLPPAHRKCAFPRLFEDLLHTNIPMPHGLCSRSISGRGCYRPRIYSDTPRPRVANSRPYG